MLKHTRTLTMMMVGALLVTACSATFGGTDIATTSSQQSTAPAASTSTSPGASGSQEDAAFVPLDLPIGTCFDDPAADVELVTSEDIPIVDCASPHDNEVYASVDIGGEPFPGEDEVQNLSEEICFAEFEAYIGEPYETSIYEFSWYFPTMGSWHMGGTNVICFAYDMDFTEITGSINGIGQ